jgi:hypothetical protein
VVPRRSSNGRLMNASRVRARQAALSGSSVHFAVHFPVLFIYPEQYV